MNIELLEYCLKGLRKRWKEVLRTSIVIFIAFTFVAGTLIFQNNMYKWQIQSAKSRFGSWYVMYEGSVKAENNDLKIIRILELPVWHRLIIMYIIRWERLI